MSSDSSSSEDDVMLREAVDCSLFTNSMFQDRPKDSPKIREKVAAKSNRKVDEVVNVKEDIQVTPSMQQFVAKKLSNLIANQVQFVEIDESKTVDQEDDIGGIRLFSNSAPVSELTSITDGATQPESSRKRKKPKKRVRDSSPDESTKISESVVDPADIIDQVEVKSWHKNGNRMKKRTDYYNSRNGNLFPVEPINEFSALRKKNNWDYKKIRLPIKRKVD